MGRPPNHGGSSRFTGERERLTRRYFSLPIPPVDSFTFDAVQNFIREREPCLAQRAAWEQARNKSERLQEEVKALQRRLDDLNEEKEQAIRDIEATRDEQLERTLQKIVRKIRSEFDREQKEKDEEFEEELRMERERHEEALEKEKEKQMDESEKIDQAPPKKRPKLNPESENSRGIAEKNEGDSDSSDLEEGELEEGAMEESKVEATETTKSDEEVSKKDGSYDVKEGPVVASGQEEDLEEPQGTLESETRKEELKIIETQVENLKESRSQMVWLLRQVITAENEKKRKDKEKKTKKS